MWHDVMTWWRDGDGDGDGDGDDDDAAINDAIQRLKAWSHLQLSYKSRANFVDVARTWLTFTPEW